jgi:hypothetical protein
MVPSVMETPRLDSFTSKAIFYFSMGAFRASMTSTAGEP